MASDDYERAASGSHQINFVHDATARFPGTVFVPYDKVTTCEVKVDTRRIMRPKCIFIDGWIGENVDVRQAASCVATSSPDGLRSVVYKISPLMVGAHCKDTYPSHSKLSGSPNVRAAL